MIINKTELKEKLNFLYLILLGFISEPSNYLKVQNIGCLFLVGITILIVFFSKDIKLILSHLILLCVASAWLGDFVPVLPIPGGNYATLISLLAFFFYIIRFKQNVLLNKGSSFLWGLILFSLWVIVDIVANVNSQFPLEWIPLIGSYFRIFTIMLYASHLGFIERYKEDSYYTLLLLISGVWGISLNYVSNLFTGNLESYDDLMTLRNMLYFDPNYTAVVSGAVFLIFFILFSQKRDKYFSIIGMIFSLLTMIAAGSRTAIIGTAVPLMIIGTRKIFAFVLLVLSFTLFLYTYSSEIPAPIVERFTKVQEGYEDSRESVFVNAIYFISKEPIWGNGKKYYMGSDSIIEGGAHNTYLEILAEGGLVYFTILMLFIVFTYFKIKNLVFAKEKEFYLGIHILYIISSLGVSYSLGDFFFIIYFSIIVFAFYKYPNIKHENSFLYK